MMGSKNNWMMYKKQAIAHLSTKPGVLTVSVLMAIVVSTLILSPSEEDEKTVLSGDDSLNQPLNLPLPINQKGFVVDQANISTVKSETPNEIKNIDRPFVEIEVVDSTEKELFVEEHELEATSPIKLANTSASTSSDVIEALNTEEKAPINNETKKIVEEKLVETPSTKKRKAVDSWVFAKNPEQYTIQLIGSSNKKEIQRFIKANNVNNDLSYFHSIKKNKSWYVVVQGSYKTFSETEMVRKKLPQSLAKYGPWTRKYSSIQKEISANAEKIILMSNSFASSD